jgi:hypothetical protein
VEPSGIDDLGGELRGDDAVQLDHADEPGVGELAVERLLDLAHLVLGAAASFCSGPTCSATSWLTAASSCTLSALTQAARRA